jgi:hypothetical protein
VIMCKSCLTGAFAWIIKATFTGDGAHASSSAGYRYHVFVSNRVADIYTAPSGSDCIELTARRAFHICDFALSQ